MDAAYLLAGSVTMTMTVETTQMNLPLTVVHLLLAGQISLLAITHAAFQVDGFVTMIMTVMTILMRLIVHIIPQHLNQEHVALVSSVVLTIDVYRSHGGVIMTMTVMTTVMK